MPTYVYGCDTCSHRFEAYQKFQDSPLAECPECGARIRRIMQPTGIHFKGSGWYSTDSRASNASASSKEKEKTEAGEKSENGVSSKADQTPKADGATTGKTTKSETDKTKAPAPAKAD